MTVPGQKEAESAPYTGGRCIKASELVHGTQGDH